MAVMDEKKRDLLLNGNDLKTLKALKQLNDELYIEKRQSSYNNNNNNPIRQTSKTTIQFYRISFQTKVANTFLKVLRRNRSYEWESIQFIGCDGPRFVQVLSEVLSPNVIIKHFCFWSSNIVETENRQPIIIQQQQQQQQLRNEQIQNNNFNNNNNNNNGHYDFVDIDNGGEVLSDGTAESGGRTQQQLSPQQVFDSALAKVMQANSTSAGRQQQQQQQPPQHVGRKRLESIHLRYVSLHEGNTRHLLEYIENESLYLKELIWNDCWLRGSSRTSGVCRYIHTNILFKTIAKLPSIQTLDLSSCGLDNTDLTILMGELQSNPCLQTLDLSQNQFNLLEEFSNSAFAPPCNLQTLNIQSQFTTSNPRMNACLCPSFLTMNTILNKRTLLECLVENSCLKSLKLSITRTQRAGGGLTFQLLANMLARGGISGSLQSLTLVHPEEEYHECLEDTFSMDAMQLFIQAMQKHSPRIRMKKLHLPLWILCRLGLFCLYSSFEMQQQQQSLSSLFHPQQQQQHASSSSSSIQQQQQQQSHDVRVRNKLLEAWYHCHWNCCHSFIMTKWTAWTTSPTLLASDMVWPHLLYQIQHNIPVDDVIIDVHTKNMIRTRTVAHSHVWTKAREEIRISVLFRLVAFYFGSRG